MKRLLVASGCAAVLAGSVFLSAQAQLPSAPQIRFGGSVTGAFDGWFDNADGSHTFLVGYFNRSAEQAVDIPIGPNNRIEPGGPDMGQPTHFLAGRNVGMFTVTVPKDFTKQQKLTWTIVANGITNAIPLRMNTDYNVSPFGEDAGAGNRPPIVRFDEKGATITGPIASMAKPVQRRTTSVSTPLALNIWADDDAKYSSGTNAPIRNPPPPVGVLWTKFRGPGPVTFQPSDAPKLDVLKGGKVGEPFSGKGAVTATFSEPGDYALLAIVTDYSGFGGGGEVCCWTTGIVTVTVTK
ncbi:MAG: hypothetical protein FJW27_08990 [Acidimicrobiia bacterium]|nr:hypothetical protein [Acidimicrobiia bacterium]